VTAVGARLRTDPPTGDELTNDVALAGATKKVVVKARRIRELSPIAIFFINHRFQLVLILPLL
jgi:hypothetical protein